MEQFIHYLCGDAANPNALNETEALRITFYKAVAVFIRAFASIAQNLAVAGYSDTDAAALQQDVEFYGEIRAAIKKHSGEELDIKPYEADMRHLINTYIQADPAGDRGDIDGRHGQHSRSDRRKAPGQQFLWKPAKACAMLPHGWGAVCRERGATQVNDHASLRGAVAVVAVHGVGSPNPGETALAVADLLEDEIKSQFISTRLRVPQSIADSEKPPSRTTIRQMVLARDVTTALGDAVTSAHWSAYSPPRSGDTYVTCRLESGGTEQPIHVYELHWADLAKERSPTAYVFLRRLFMLPAHAMRLAQRTAAYADQNRSASGIWPLQRLALAVLAWLMAAIVALNLAALLCDVAFYGKDIAVVSRNLLVLSAIGAVSFFFVASWALRRRRAGWGLALAAPMGAAIAVPSATSYLLNWRTDGLSAQRLFPLGLVMLGLAGAIAFLNGMERRWTMRGFLLIAGALVLVLSAVFEVRTSVETVAAAAWLGVAVGWIAAVFISFLLAVGTLVLWLRPHQNEIEQRRGRDAAATCAVAVTLSVLALLLAQGFVINSAAPAALRLSGIGGTPARQLALNVIDAFTYPAAITAPALVAALAIVMSYGLGPAIVSELVPSSKNPESYALGNWISRGLVLLRGTVLAGLFVAVLAPLGVFVLISLSAAARPLLTKVADGVWAAIAAGTIAWLGALVRSPGSLTSVSPLFGIVFDVDSYMDEYPANATRRGRMLNRFSALVDCIERWRDPLGRPYERIVIVAHSQGTVLAADSLRFLRLRHGGPKGPPKTLVSMGTPLQAIYERAFPDLYAWVDGAGNGPEPVELGIERWVNLYRAGDYIGRDLWSASARNRFEHDYCRMDSARRLEERCLGAGAHTAYWRDRQVGQAIVRELSQRRVA